MEYAEHIAFLFAFYLVVAYSQAIVTGYLKLLTISQAAFVAIGAYSAALLATKAGLSFPLTGISGAAAASIASVFAYGLFANFDNEDQVLGSLAFQVVVVELILNLDRITQGPLGIGDIPRPANDAQITTIILLTTLFLVAIVAGTCLWFLPYTTLGKHILLVGEDRVFAEALGINVRRVRLSAMVASASVAGFAGAIFAHYFTFIEPYSFGLGESVFVLAIVIIGGGRHPLPLAFATFFLVLLPEFLRFILGSGPLAANFRQLLFGVALIAALAAPALRRHLQEVQK